METELYKKIGTYKIERKKKSVFGLKERNPKYSFKSLELVLVKESEYFENIESNLAVRINNGKIQNEISNEKINDLAFIADAYIAEQKFQVKDNYWDKDIIEEELHFKLTLTLPDKPLEIPLKQTVTRRKQNAKAKISIKKNDDYNDAKAYNDVEDDFGSIIIENIARGHAYPLEIKNLSISVENKANIICIDSPKKTILIQPGGEAEFGLTINMAQLPHPKENQEYTISISGEKKINDNSFTPIIPANDFAKCTFILSPNRKKTDLFLDVNGDDKTRYDNIAVNDIAYDLETTMDTKVIADIKLGNRSNVYDETNNDYLEISQLSISKAIFPTDEKQEKDEAFKQKISNIIKIYYKYKIDEKPSEISQKTLPVIQLKNGKNAYVTLKVKIAPKDFKALDAKLENKTNIDILLSFNYIIKDYEGRIKKGLKSKIYKISFQIRQYEGDEWLAVDFGTSAIVAQYGTAVSNDLKSNVKSQFIKLVEKEGTYVSEDYDETSSTLLSSTIGLRKNRILSGKFEDSTVSVSPRLQVIYRDEEYILPYLKSLVGHEKLPDDYLKLIDDETLKKLKPIEIIKEVYKVLLNSLVIPAYKDIRKNKIILTIPNSFTTLHKNILQSIVKNNLKDIWEDYIIFVSESDAVAWYYIDHSHELLSHAIDTAKAETRKKVSLKDEVVLVYDMGAGTLDLTLFRIQTKEGKREITILGKIGQISGGNYADYVIGKEFWEQVKNKDKNIYNPMKAGKLDGFANEKIKYRMFVRNELKPAITDLDQSIIKTEAFYGGSCILPKPIDFDSLINSEAYKSYLHKNTTSILKLLKSTFGWGDAIQIHTLVLSGRGVQLRGLKETLQNAIREQFSDSDPLTIQIKDKEKLKTIVSEGAIYYATQKTSETIVFNPLHITARYGILKRLTGRQYYYEEVLNSDAPSAKKINFNDTYVKGTEIERNLGNLNGVEEVIIIKTYLQKDTILTLLNDVSDTREKSLESYYQSSSHIITFNRNKDFNKDKNKITMVIDLGSEIYIKFNNTIKTEFVVPASDMENSEFFKKPMWYLF